MSLGISAATWAGIGAVGSIGVGLYGASQAGDAADAQVDATRDASATQWRMYDQNRQDMQPWRDAGTVALSQLTAGTGAGGDYARDFTLADFQRDPGYQFRMDQGTQALERSAAARGGALSGGALKALTRYGQDYASGEYQNAYNRFNADRDRRFNRLASLANVGQTATRDVSSAGLQTAQTVGNNQLSAGNARASGYVGGANALSNGMNSLQSLYFMNKLTGGGNGVTTSTNKIQPGDMDYWPE